MAWRTSTAKPCGAGALALALWKSPEKLIRKLHANTAPEAVSFREIRVLRVYPPSPHPSECLDWRGICKKCLQNLDVKEVGGQNLDNKELKPYVAVFIYTASALTIIGLLPAGSKVRCHMRL